MIDTATTVIAPAILLLAAYRGLTIGRGLTSRVYRNRAFWIAALCIGDVLQSLVPDNWMLGQLPLFELTFFALVFVVFIFIDSTILVTLEMDFFHRNTLRWRQMRLVIYSYFLVFGAAAGIVTYLGVAISGPESLFAGLAIALYGYSVITLIVSALRTPDRTLRRHILLLGVVILISAVTTFTFNDTSIPAVDILDDVLAVLANSVIYLAVMALSPVGRVEKDAGEAVTRPTTASRQSP